MRNSWHQTSGWLWLGMSEIIYLLLMVFWRVKEFEGLPVGMIWLALLESQFSYRVHVDMSAALSILVGTFGGAAAALEWIAQRVCLLIASRMASGN